MREGTKLMNDIANLSKCVPRKHLNYNIFSIENSVTDLDSDQLSIFTLHYINEF